ncbi:hypothetical protein BJX70DRAFT_107849 [Aspergillus crustosus]
MAPLATGPGPTAEDHYQMALTTARFEKEYDQIQVHTLELLHAERGRMHCLEQLLLCIENESLQLRVNQRSQELNRAREEESEARVQLDGVIRELKRSQGIARTSSRELENLRCELASSNVAAAEFQKLQANKVHLSKEISNLQAEVERLKSQNISIQDLLAEKHNLTQLLNTLEVESKSEKRTHERTLAKESQQAAEIAALTLSLEEVRQELEVARRSGQAKAWQADQVTTAQPSPGGRITGGAHGTSAHTQDRHQDGTPIQRQQEAWNSTTSQVPAQRPTGVLPNLPGRLPSELTIATPGAVRAHNQQKHYSTLPGDKSAFSITPFLDRTAELGGASSSDDELNDLNTVSDSVQSVDLSKVTGRGTNTITLAKQLKQPGLKQLYKVENQIPVEVTLDGNIKDKQKLKKWDGPVEMGNYQTAQSRATVQTQTLSKKRKLGLKHDKGIFDEDKADNLSHDTRKPGRKPVGTGQASSRIFNGGFSPLKRDRKRF